MEMARRKGIVCHVNTAHRKQARNGCPAHICVLISPEKYTGWIVQPSELHCLVRCFQAFEIYSIFWKVVHFRLVTDKSKKDMLDAITLLTSCKHCNCI